MRKTNVLKACIMVLIIAISTVSPFGLTACKKSDSTIRLIVKHSIYEYDPVEQTSSKTPISDNRIEIGQYYRVVFNITCDDLEASVQDDEVDVQMTVNMGDYENNYNKKKLLNSGYATSGGLKFSEQQNQTGVWQTTFTITKAGLPDFSKCEFIIIMPSKGSGSSISDSHQDMTVRFDNIGKDKSHKVLIPSTSRNDYAVTLKAIQGKMDFSYQENIMSTSAGINSIIVKAPPVCVSIAVDLYFDSDKSAGYYGGKKYLDAAFEGQGTNKWVTIDFRSLMIEFIGEDRYLEKLDSNDPSVYVVLTADGGNNYNTESFGFTQQLRG